MSALRRWLNSQGTPPFRPPIRSLGQHLCPHTYGKVTRGMTRWNDKHEIDVFDERIRDVGGEWEHLPTMNLCRECGLVVECYAPDIISGRTGR